jgi:hypothetical protein
MGADGRACLTLDDQMILAAARSDPIVYFRGLDRAIIDEAKRVPDLILAIERLEPAMQIARRPLSDGRSRIYAM